jgi:hypothetical protein
MKKNNQFINIEVKMLIENQRASIKFYTIFAGTLLIVSIAFKMSHSLHCVLSHVRQLKVSHYEEM